MVARGRRELEELSTEVLNNDTHYVLSGEDPQDKIDEASAGDRVLLEAVEHTADSWPVTIDKALSFGGTAFTSGRMGQSDDIDGAILNVDESGKNAIEITVEEKSVHLHDFGIVFDSGLSTGGHGIVADAPSDGGSNKVLGLWNSEWRNITVRGHGGDHYAWRLYNPVLNNFYNLKFSGGGGIEFVADHASYNTGNSEIYSLMGYIAPGSAHGIHYRAESSFMNLNTYFRPQLNASVSLDAGQKHVQHTDNGGEVKKNFYVAANMESFDGATGGANYAIASKCLPIIHSAPVDNTAVTMLDGKILGGQTKIDSLDIDTRLISAWQHNLYDSTISTLHARLRNRNGENRWEDEQGGTNFTHYDKSNDVERWKSKGDGGMFLQAQDLSQLTLVAADDKDLYLHDGANPISADGGTTSAAGYYAWDNGNDEFTEIVAF